MHAVRRYWRQQGRRDAPPLPSEGEPL